MNSFLVPLRSHSMHLLSTLIALGMLLSQAEATTLPAPTPTPPVQIIQGVPNTFIPENSTGLVINLPKHIKVPITTTSQNNLVMVNSSMGNFYIQLFPTNAPITTANFFFFVFDSAYTDMLLHRSVPGFVIQTGGYTANGSLSPIDTFPAITNEFGISNARGTVAMALVGTNPNSATSQWFINLTNNSSILDATNTAGNPPFAVFGEVIGNGMSVVDAIAALPTDNFQSFGFSSAFTTVPLQNWTNGGGVYLNNLVVITNVLTLPYFATSSDPSSFSTEVQGSNLIVTPIAPNTAPVTITLHGSDTNGHTVATSFQVTQQKLTQNITFNTIYTGYTNGGFSFPSFPSTSSGLGVSLAIKSGPAYVSNGQLRFSGTGVVTLIASQSGNFFYFPAPPVAGFIVVDKGIQKITFPKIPNQTNAVTPFNLNLTNFPTANSSLLVSVAIQSGLATLKGKSLAITGTGTITLTASQPGNTNYYPAPSVTNSFVVTNTNTSTNTNAVTNSIITGN